MRVESLLAAATSLMATAAWGLLPGLPWALLLRRRHGLDWLTTAALASLLGLGIGTGLAMAMTMFDALGPLPAAAAAGAITALGFVLLVGSEVRGALGDVDAGRPLPSVPRVDRRRVLQALPVILYLLVVAPQLISAMPDGLPRTTTSWYYWNLARLTAEEGGLPATVLEWGEPRPFKDDYLPFTSHLATAETLDPTGGLATLEAYRIVLLVLGAVILLALGSLWGTPGVLMAGLVATSSLWVTKFSALRPESFALVFLLGALWSIVLAWRAQTRRSRTGWTVLAGISGGLTALSHLEVLMVGAALGVALLVAEGGLRRPLSWLTAIAASAIALVSAGIVFLLAGSGIPGSEELGTRSGDAGDPSWSMYLALVRPADLGLPPPDSWTDRTVLAATARFPWLYVDVLGWQGVLLILVLAAAAIAVVAGGLDPPSPETRLLIFGVAATAIIFLASIAVFEAFDTYVPRRIGPRRFMPYETIGLAAILAAGASAGLRALRRPTRLRRSPIAWPAGRREKVVTACGVLCLTAAGVLAALGAVRPILDRGDRTTSFAGRDAYVWLRQNTPPDARILLNGYSDGVVAALAERPGILDGRAPYDADPVWRNEAMRDAIAAWTFFGRPEPTTLDGLDADYLVVGSGRDLALVVTYPIDEERLAERPELDLVRAFGAVKIYRVR